MNDLDRVVPEMYAELQRLARAIMRGQRSDHTLQPTALVHEAYVKLTGASDLRTASRAELLSLAARAMRQVLVDHARGRGRTKRGGERLRVTLSEDLAPKSPLIVDALALDQALSRLELVDPQQARLVELRFLTGLTLEEAAEVLGISSATAKRDTAMAKAWLFLELGGKAQT